MAEPSSSFLRMLLGGPLSSNLRKSWPELEQSWAGREIEMPEEAADVNKIAEMNWLQKRMYPDTYGVTSPFGTIGLNRELIEKDKQNLGDVLVHELAHVGQGKGGFLRKFYEPNKLEDEAVNREALRNVRREDIPLRGTEIDPTRQIPTVKLPEEQRNAYQPLERATSIGPVPSKVGMNLMEMLAGFPLDPEYYKVNSKQDIFMNTVPNVVTRGFGKLGSFAKQANPIKGTNDILGEIIDLANRFGYKNIMKTR